MRIRALANGNVIEADDEAAKILIDNKIYEATDEPVTASLTPPIPANNSTQPASPTPRPVPAKRRKTR